MNNDVLALKYRPKFFKDVTGQDIVVQTLQNSLELKKIHNAYLFSGTRGMGKTTMARLFAKSLLCKEGINREPCGKCSTCLEIDNASHLDLIEIDIISFLILFSFLLSIGFLSYLLNSILGQILAVKRETLAYIFNNLRFLFRLSIFIFIILVIHYYYFFDTFIFLSTTSLCLFIFYFLYSIVIIYKFLRNLDKGKLYFILYVCTLKITPWVFMYWFINNI